MNKIALACSVCFMFCRCGSGTDEGRDVEDEGDMTDDADVGDVEPEGEECETDADCANGLVCDGEEKCVDGECQAGEPRNVRIDIRFLAGHS